MDDILTWFAKETVQHAILNWAWLLVAALLAGSGYVLGAIVFGRRYKERLAADLEAKDKRIADLEAKVAALSTPPQGTNHEDLGYEILTWWDEPDNVVDQLRAATSLRTKRFPRAIRDKRTGEVHSVPHPKR